MDGDNYVGAYGSGWVVVVNGQWIAPGCSVYPGGGWPPPAAVVWSDYNAAASCFNALREGGGNGGTPPPPPPPPNGGIDLSKLLSNPIALAGGALVLIALLRRR